jgi:uncharacterized protein (TIGR02145 family)
MRTFLFLALLGLFTSFSAQETLTYPYNPDGNVDGTIAAPDLLDILGVYGNAFTPAEIQINGEGLLQVIQDLQNQIDNNSLPDGTLIGDKLRWDGTAWIPVSHGESTACGAPVEHEGYSYATVRIGDQCWFSENCRYLPEVSPSSEESETNPYYYVYGYEGSDVAAAQATSNYDTYGVLYNWPAVMTGDICPSGWRIPTDFEWGTMEMALGMGASDATGYGYRGSDQGYQMKSTSGWNSGSNGSNSSGFTGLPGGYRYSGGFSGNGYFGYWWSASESGSFSWKRTLDYYYDNVLRDYNSRNYGFSARCVRD